MKIHVTPDDEELLRPRGRRIEALSWRSGRRRVVAELPDAGHLGLLGVQDSRVLFMRRPSGVGGAGRPDPDPMLMRVPLDGSRAPEASGILRLPEHRQLTLHPGGRRLAFTTRTRRSDSGCYVVSGFASYVASLEPR